MTRALAPTDRISMRCIIGTIAMMSAVSASASVTDGSWHVPFAFDTATHLSQLNVSVPTELAGMPFYSHTAVAGPMFLAERENDYRLPVRIVIPNSLDDATACLPLTHPITDEGDSFQDAFALIERGGGCSFTQKVLNVAALMSNSNVTVRAVILFGCNGTDTSGCTVNANFIAPFAFAAFPVPVIYMVTVDGERIKSYMLQRRASFLTPPPANCTGVAFTSIAAAEAAGCPPPALQGSVRGTGPLVDVTELVALQVLAESLYFNPLIVDIPWLRPWADLLVHPEFDPCVYRLLGLWCEAGHVVAIDLDEDGVNGTLPVGSLAPFTQLQYLILWANDISGPLPVDLCSLTQLLTIEIDGNAFTSIPSCIGGGEFLEQRPNGVVATVQYPGAQSLRLFAASNNALTNLPASFSRLNATLLVLSLFNNALDCDFPVSLFELHQLQQLQLYGNPNLRLDFDATPVPAGGFGRMPQLSSLLLRGCGFRGTMPTDLFDGCAALQALELSAQVGGKLSGSLPTLVGCTSLVSLSIESNAFSGGIPESWTTSLPALTTLSLLDNQIGGAESASMVKLRNLVSLTSLTLAQNNISNSLFDVGQSVWVMLGPKVSELFISHNRLAGEWGPSNWLPPSLNLLDISYNGVTNLPADLWQSRLTVSDWSFNALSGPMPFDSPMLSPDATSGRQPVREFDIEGNPNLVASPLPSWLHFAVPVRWVLSADGQFQCMALSSVSELFRVTVDPTFTNFQGCECGRGLFGTPPLCSLLPQSARISPYTLPSSTDVGPTFAQVILWNGTTSPVAFNVSDGSNSVLVPFVANPYAATDQWYGSNRFTSGMSTRWTADLSNLRSTNNGTQLRLMFNASAPLPSDANGGDPVRVVTVRLHISLTDFSSDSSLSVFAGDDISNTLVDAITGTDLSRLQSLPVSTPYTSTAAYRAAYADDLAQVSNAVVLEVPVLSSQATVFFSSRSEQGVHFLATYSYAFECPDSMEPTSNEASTSGTVSCVHPAVGAARSLMILVVSISAAIIVFVFCWLLWERYHRQKVSHQLSAQSIILRELGPASGRPEDSLDASLVEEKLIEQEVRRLFELLRAGKHRALIKEAALEIVGLVWELISAVLNCQSQ